MEFFHDEFNCRQECVSIVMETFDWSPPNFTSEYEKKVAEGRVLRITAVMPLLQTEAGCKQLEHSDVGS